MNLIKFKLPQRLEGFKGFPRGLGDPVPTEGQRLKGRNIYISMLILFMVMMIIDLDHLKDIEALEPSRLGEVVAEVVVVEVEADQGVHHRPGHLVV